MEVIMKETGQVEIHASGSVEGAILGEIWSKLHEAGYIAINHTGPTKNDMKLQLIIKKKPTDNAPVEAAKKLSQTGSQEGLKIYLKARQDNG